MIVSDARVSRAASPKMGHHGISIKQIIYIIIIEIMDH